MIYSPDIFGDSWDISCHLPACLSRMECEVRRRRKGKLASPGLESGWPVCAVCWELVCHQYPGSSVARENNSHISVSPPVNITLTSRSLTANNLNKRTNLSLKLFLTWVDLANVAQSWSGKCCSFSQIQFKSSKSRRVVVDSPAGDKFSQWNKILIGEFYTRYFHGNKT